MADRPLAGVRVLEAATLAAAPLVATYLAELGADVVKVEQPGVGDPIRYWGAQRDGGGLLWKSVGRNKRSVTLDLRHAEGQRIFRALAGRSDVVVLNTRPATLESWGLGHERLRAVNDRLVVVHISLFGSGGPKANFPGFGTLAEALSGFAHLTGPADGPPTLPSFMLADGIASLTAAYAAIAALYHRDVAGGGGQLVEVSLIEPLSRFLEYAVFEYDETGVSPRRAGNMSRVSVPRNTYRTKDGQWIAMSGSAPGITHRLFKAMGRADLVDDPRYGTQPARVANVDAVDALIGQWVAERTLGEAMAVFEEYEVAAAPVYEIPQLLDDPHIRDRGVFVRVPDEEVGTVRVQAPVPRLSGTPARIDHLGPALGAHTDEVLSTTLGLSERELADLRVEGVI